MADHSRGVPIALNAQGQVVEPESADPSGRYTCLGCGERVNLIATYQRIMYEQVVHVPTHFSHLAGSQCSISGESLLHLASKLSLQQYCQQNDVLRFYIECPVCRDRRIKKTQLHATDEVLIEVTVGSFRPDVAIRNRETGQIRLGIEVLHKHAVDEAKAAGLGIPWFEVVTGQLFRTDRDKRKAIAVYNSNYFALHPCGQCGNDAFSFREAILRQEAKRRQAEEEARARRLQAQQEADAEARARWLKEQEERLERRRALTESQKQREYDRPTPPILVVQGAALTQEQERLRLKLLTDIPDIFHRLLAFTCTLTVCPECQQEGLFFDPRGMNMMPTWTDFVSRRTPSHPSECRCRACGWHDQKPPAGQLFVFRQAAQTSPPATPYQSAQKHPPTREKFWWNDDD